MLHHAASWHAPTPSARSSSGRGWDGRDTDTLAASPIRMMAPLPDGARSALPLCPKLCPCPPVLLRPQGHLIHAQRPPHHHRVDGSRPRSSLLYRHTEDTAYAAGSHSYFGCTRVGTRRRAMVRCARKGLLLTTHHLLSSKPLITASYSRAMRPVRSSSPNATTRARLFEGSAK